MKKVICALLLACSSSVLTSAHATEIPPKNLVVTNSASFVPFSFLDNDNQPKGLLIDFWQLFGERNDVKVTFKLVEWSKSLELIRHGQADVHGGLLMTETRAEFLDFTKEIAPVRTLLFVRTGSGVTKVDELGNKSVGIIDSAFEQEFMTTYFPSVVLRPYPKSEVMVGSALSGEIDAFVTDFPTGHYHLISMKALDRFRAEDTLFTETMVAGVRKNSDALLEFINAGFDKISQDDLGRIRARWFIPEEPVPSWMLPTSIAIAVMVVIAALVAHYVSLRRTVRRRTEALSTTIEQLKSANVELDRMARSDPLTGLANRHHFYEVAAREIERAKRYARPLSLALFDLDRFKAINDRFGHLAGDAVLINVAKSVAPVLRETDVFARIGGDEFAALLPETNKEDAVRLAERILARVLKAQFEYEGQLIEHSFSAGIAEFDVRDSIEDWLRRADEQLYRSKAVQSSRSRADAIDRRQMTP